MQLSRNMTQQLSKKKATRIYCTIIDKLIKQ